MHGAPDHRMAELHLLFGAAKTKLKYMPALFTCSGMIGATVEYFYSYFACLHVRPACALGEPTSKRTWSRPMDSLNKAR